jgi:hypothetical protein
MDLQTLTSTIVGTGGAWLLGSAMLHSRSGKWNATQLRGLVYAGLGFLMSAASARWLQHLGNRGIAVSLAGTLIAFRGMYLLVRERAAEKANAERAPEKPQTPE